MNEKEEIDNFLNWLYASCESQPDCFIDLETGELIDNYKKLEAFAKRRGIDLCCCQFPAAKAQGLFLDRGDDR
jgi:hypothetical protein